MTDTNSSVDTTARQKLAARIPAYGFWTIGIVAALIIAGSIFVSYKNDDPSTFFEAGKYVLGVLLPVIAAWVGAIIAFYFGKDNYETAVQGTKTLVRELSSRERLKSISVESVMLRMDDPNIKKLELTKAEDQYKIKDDVLTVMGDKNRLPIHRAGVVQYMSHKSLLHDFLIEWVGQKKPLDTATLKDLLSQNKYGDPLRNGFGTVSQSATLADVKDKITPVVADVFVTTDGSKNSKAIGWITNVIVAKNSTAKLEG